MNDSLIPLLCAHVLGDFLLQPDWMAGEKKRRMGILFQHAVIHGGLAYLLLQQWGWWQVALGMALSHALIDFFKSRVKTGPTSFLVDQAAHLLVIFVAFILLKNGLLWQRITGQSLMLMITGFVSAVWGGGHFIRLVAARLCEENKDLKAALGKGLKNGGALIGKLERALIFLLVFMGQPGGVGFLIAAKSIIRFEEAKKQPLAEYVLIGTLWSFGLAMAIAVFTKHTLGMF